MFAAVVAVGAGAGFSAIVAIVNRFELMKLSTCVVPLTTPHRLFPLAKLLGSARNGALSE